MRDLGIRVLIEGVNLQRLLLGLAVTARIAFIAVAFSMVLGVPFGILMTRRNAALRFLCRFYLEAMRIIPVLVWLFIFYFGLARNFHINLSAAAAAVLVFTLWGTAEMGDIVRGAVTSLHRHQYESAHALGLSEVQLYLYVIIPQAARRLVPGAINLTTRMIKTTSLVVLIGIVEMLKVGQQIIESNFLKSPTAAFWVYGLIFFLYFILCMPVSRLSKRLERRWQS
ncbi:MAG: amino acid ABC transporter permease [Spirochaetales bacterium]|jgi:polar amino acid transport system permease protein|nr:amino acid ABC transporter permease [Spirochaetales bacterium]